MATKKKPTPEKPEHLVQKPFAEMLSQFTAMGAGGFGSVTPMTPAAFQDVKKPNTPKRGSDDDGGVTYLDVAFEVNDEPFGSSSVKSVSDDEDDFFYSEDFDDLIEGAFEADENVGLRNQLISMGRKYAIKGAESAEDSEVTRAFSKQEQAIYGLIDEFQKAGADLQRDIDMMRTARTRNYKSLSEMVEVQASLLNGKLSAIKELNKMAKDKFDINIKIKGNSTEGGDSTTASRAIQQIFSMGRQSMATLDSPGDSGATDDVVYGGPEPEGSQYDDGTPQSAIEGMRPIPKASSDGDKFIEYEDRFGDYVLDIGEDGKDRQIYAIDKSGNVIPDYPVPTEVETLNFMINELTGTATDQLQRSYRVRKNGVDLSDS